MLVACGVIFFAFKGTEESEQRRQAVAELSEANRKLEITLAENAGLHEQLLTQAREAGVSDERQRMAREIHDTLAQSLAGIITQLQAADQASRRRRERRRHLDAAPAAGPGEPVRGPPVRARAAPRAAGATAASSRPCAR